MTAMPPDPHRGPAPPTALVGIDWGTTHVRAMRLAADGQVLAEYRDADMREAVAEKGHAAVYQRLRTALGVGNRVPALLTGMVGSSIGWTDAGYVDCPAQPDAIGATLTPAPDHPEAFIVPGVRLVSRGRVDLMRGEETQLMGLLATGADSGDGIRSGVVCLPGTHSKWVRLDRGGIRSFRTFMTGEMFYLWTHHGILGRELEGHDHQPEAFARGVSHGAQPAGLMHHLFSGRALPLTRRLRSTAIHSWLSGLLIGHECREMRALWPESTAVILVGAPALTARYAEALRQLGAVSTEIDGATAVARGLVRIARRAGLITTD